MDEFTNDVYESLNKYFFTLSRVGYKSYTEVNKLLALIFIEEMLHGPMSQFITEDDYRTITDSLDCLYGSCMIPYPNYKASFDGIVYKVPNEYRITENGSMRLTEKLNTRVKA